MLSPEWLRTTILVWIAWWAMSLGELVSILGHQSVHLHSLSVYNVQRVSPKVVGNESRTWGAKNAGTELMGCDDLHYWGMSWRTGTSRYLDLLCLYMNPILYFNLAWRLSDRVSPWSTMVSSREHICYSVFLCCVCPGLIDMGCENQHYGDQLERDGALRIAEGSY